MRSFIIALVLLISVTVFVTWNSARTTDAIDEMLSLAGMLPETAEVFEESADLARENVEKLFSLWDEKFPSIAFTAGYENTNRCDEAIGALYVHFQNGNAVDFTSALSEFCDCLERLRDLEGFCFEGIF